MQLRPVIALLAASMLANVAIAGDKGKKSEPAPAPAAEPAPAPAAATGSTADLVKYRQREMGAIGRHFGASSMIIEGKVDRPEDLLGHTAALVDLGRDLASQFPKGSGPDEKYETEAIPKIWLEADAFAAAVTAYETAAAALHAAAEARDMAALPAAHEKLGESCGGCHDQFTKED